ncbi:MAG: OadG family protein [Oscillospiraceae bacterium]|nr:OadG family protein [Oscillospiraceae bacterium]
MHPLLLANHLIMLAGGIDGNKKPLDGSEIWGVTLVGLGTVIAALALLVVVILLFGKIFDQINKNQKAKEAAEAAKKKPKQAPVKKAAPAPAQPQPAAAKSAPPAVQAVPASDDDEVIAVISAVVAMMSEQDGKTYRIKSVARSHRTGGFDGRSAWAMDGRRQNVNPF